VKKTRQNREQNFDLVIFDCDGVLVATFDDMRQLPDLIADKIKSRSLHDKARNDRPRVDFRGFSL
jgi:phosphoglycolate phosphatase-like HAD superfamily hydrolase